MLTEYQFSLVIRYLKIWMINTIVHHLNDLLNGTLNFPGAILWFEIPLINNPLIQKVLSMHLDQLSWKEYCLYHFLIFTSWYNNEKSHTYFYYDFSWRKHFMVDWSIESLECSICFLFLAQSYVWGYVSDVEYLTLVIVKEKVNSFK